VDGHIVEAFAPKGDVAAIGYLQTGYYAKQGGLATAARTEQTDDLRFVDRERYVLENGDASEQFGYGGHLKKSHGF
jgi:hypothetical protein